MSFPNQKIVTIKKEKCDKENLYAKINLQAMQKAMCDLKNKGSIKLWFYFAKNQPYHTLELSWVECEKWGLKKDAYHDAVNDLIDKGYLQNIRGNEYFFAENGVSRENPISS